MNIQSISSLKSINFGEVTVGVNNFHVATRASLATPTRTIFEGPEFEKDVFEYARKRAKLSKEYNMRSVIFPEDIAKLTSIFDIAARKKEVLKLLMKKGFIV